LGGYQMLLRADGTRGKFRKSYEKPDPFVPGEKTKVSFTLQDIHHLFRNGHRIMVQVQSSWCPLRDRNPQNSVDSYNTSEPDFQKATHRVFGSGDLGSYVTVGVLKQQR